MQEILNMTKGELLAFVLRQYESIKSWIEVNPLPSAGLGVFSGVVLTLYFKLLFSIFIIITLGFGLLYVLARNEEL